MFNKPYSIALRLYLGGRDWKIPFSTPFAVRIRRGSRNWHSFLVGSKEDWILLVEHLEKEELEKFGINPYSSECDSVARMEKNPRKGDEILVYEEETKRWVEVGCR